MGRQTRRQPRADSGSCRGGGRPGKRCRDAPKGQPQHDERRPRRGGRVGAGGWCLATSRLATTGRLRAALPFLGGDLSLRTVGKAVDNTSGNCWDRCPARAARRCPRKRQRVMACPAFTSIGSCDGRRFMNWLRVLALQCPPCSLTIGGFFVGIAGTMLVLGLRTGRLLSRISRTFARLGLEPPADVLAAWPWWLRLLVPESVFGYLVAAALFGIGLWLIYLGKWAKRVG